MLTISLPFLFQMHHPIQMKPADSEKTSGKWIHMKCRVTAAKGWERKIFKPRQMGCDILKEGGGWILSLFNAKIWRPEKGLSSGNVQQYTISI